MTHIAGVFIDHSNGIEAAVITGTPEWDDALAWCELHGIDPRRVPAGSTVTRNAPNARIHYTEFVCDDQGRLVAHDGQVDTVARVEQGEAVAPFPASIQALAAAHEDARP